MSNKNNSNNRLPELAIVLDSTMAPFVGETARLHATVNNVDVYSVLGYDWTVTDPIGVEVLVQEDERGADSHVEFPLEYDGTYIIRCSARLEYNGPANSSASLTVKPIGAEELSYIARITPPPGSAAPTSDEEVTVAGIDRPDLNWKVKEGLLVNLEVTDESKASLPTFVRLIQASKPELPRDLYLAEGEGQLRLSGSVDALFIPDGDAVAPMLQTDVLATYVAPHWAVSLDGGVLLQGSVSGAGPTSMEGAVVSLYTQHDGSGLAVPSTIGTVSSDGSFSLRGRPGRVTLSIVPKEHTAPIAMVESPDLALGTNDTGGWAFSFAPPSTVKLTASVTRDDGEAAKPGAMVVLQADDLGTVGTLQIGDKSWAATGRYRRVLATNDAGQLIDPADQSATIEMPQGTYQAVVVPAGDEESSQGRRISELVLDGDKTAKLGFARRVRVEGEVRGVDGKPVRARVMAKGILGAVTSDTNEDGRFEFDVDDEMNYSFVFRSLSNTRLGPLLTNLYVKGNTTLTNLVLPRAISLSGTVRTTSNLALPGALIRIWCSSSKCSTHAIVDETQTDSGGNFMLRVPHP